MESMDKRFIAFAALVVVGTLNREMTGLLLCLSFVAMYPYHYRWIALYGALWAFIVGMLRLLVEAIPSPFTVAYVWHLNTQTWMREATPAHIGLLIPLGVAMYAQSHRATLKPAMIVLTPYLTLYLLYAVWQETRLLMPVFIMGIPFMRSMRQST